MAKKPRKVTYPRPCIVVATGYGDDPYKFDVDGVQFAENNDMEIALIAAKEEAERALNSDGLDEDGDPIDFPADWYRLHKAIQVNDTTFNVESIPIVSEGGIEKDNVIG